ncbi:TTC28 (predicted) [Pycnogonum litorale]
METVIHRDHSEVEVENESIDSGQPCSSKKAIFLEKVRQSNAACQNGDFNCAIKLYTEAINLDPRNHILYSNRSAAFIKVGKYSRALQDALKARDLNFKWPKAYYRQGIALQCLGRHADSLAAFASGLGQDPKCCQLLAGLVEAAMKSPLRATLEPTYRQLQTMKLDKSPFVIISVIGQELLASAKYLAAVAVLESALKIGTCSLKLRGSVFSALSSAYWALNSLDKAISYMQQDLAVAKSLGDLAGECRAHGNLGSAYFSKGNFKEALTSHRYQLVLAMKCKETQAAAAALTSLGHVYTAVGDYPNALASHKQCVQLVRRMGDTLQESRETGNVGAVYLAMGDFDNAVKCHREHLHIAKKLGNKVEEARAYSNLGSSHHFKRNFEQAIAFHENVLQIAQDLRDKSIEARAYAGLGHAARCMGDYQQAKHWHEKQLDMALSTKDKVAEGRACSNLGIVYQLFGECNAALKLHQAHLNIARLLHDRAGMGRAFGNIGNAYSTMGYYEQAIKYHKQELTISKEVHDRSSEASTHGNLAVAYQALGMHEMALLHYHSHLNIARELKDTAGEACALCNLGNCHSSRGEFAQAIPYYESYLMISQELQDVEGEAKACHFLGYAHYCIGNFKEAVRYYDQDLTLAKDLQDRINMGRAYCNLGLAHLAIGNFDNSLDCQKHFLAIGHMTKNIQAKFRALGNMGDVLMKMNNMPEAVKIYQKQLLLAKQVQDRVLEANAFGALGLAHRLLKYFDKALGFHTQELTLRQEIGDIRGECKAHGHLGAVHMSLGNYTNAMKCYEEQLDRAKELHDSTIEAQSFGNLGIARLNMGHYEDAIGYFEQQLATLEQLGTATALSDKGRAYGNLGDCYDALGDFDDAIRCHEQYLAVSLSSVSTRDQERAYRGLGNSHKSVGNLQQAVVCYEKRLVVSHELNNPSAKATAYGELGNVHSMLGNYEQAISCMEHQLNIARELNDKVAESDAACGLGNVYQQMGEHDAAMKYHQLDLSIATDLGSISGQCRAYGNLGVAQESVGNFQKAISFQEQHLNLAAQINDKVAKTLAFSSLGRVHHALGNMSQAVAYLQQGLQIAEQVGRREDEAKIRHRLGLALWGHGDLETAQQQLYRASDLFESIRRDARGSSEYKLSLFDLQTASYQALQRVLVSLGREDEALVVAERGRTRAFIDLLLERQAASAVKGSNGNASRFKSRRLFNSVSVDCSSTVSLDHIVDVVNKQKACVLYFSIAAGYLYSWLIMPNKGIVNFHECNISEMEADSRQENESASAHGTLLEQYIIQVREALGVEIQPKTSTPHRVNGNNSMQSETESEAGDMWHQHLEELSDKLNHETDKTGFLRMVNRNHLFNSSNYSLSSLFSVGSIGGSTIASGSTSRRSSTRSRRQVWHGPAPLCALYNLLIAPMENHLPVTTSTTAVQQLVLVLEGDLYLVPFPVLKSYDAPVYLCERFSLIVVPSISALKSPPKPKNQKQSDNDINSALVVGNPRLPATITEQWGWGDIPYAEQEANIVAEMLGMKAITGVDGTRENVLRQISQVECIHFATHVSWKLSAIVLSPGEFVESTSKRFTSNSQPECNAECDDVGSEMSSSLDVPSLSEFLLTAADILNLRLKAKLVVISACHTRNQHGQAHSDGVVGVTRALLAAGAHCVLVSLWPVPDTAVKILLRTFYSSLLQGSKVSHALSEAMRTVQNTKQFAHPANWAGFILVGSDVRLTSKVALMGQALCDLLKTPDKCRDALRVVLHLVEKSLQRIHRGHKNAMYTTQKSIENKVGMVSSWKDLLISVGFRFEPASNGIPASVFFPQSDPGERLTLCSASLQALLGLSSTSITAVSKLLASPDCSDDIITLIRQVINQFSMKDMNADNVECPVSVNLWRIPGCHELLASLGFDLMGVGRNEVTLRMGKQANRRNIQFALQALLALFDTQEAPNSLSLGESSSMESLADSSPSESQAPSPPPPPISPPFPSHRKMFRHNFIGESVSRGAFINYVRARGEPDGRTAVSNDHPKLRTSGVGGRESDAFTPSPVDPVAHPYQSVIVHNSIARTMKSDGGVSSSPKPSPKLSLTLEHQKKIRYMYRGDEQDSQSESGNTVKRPDSSSSATSSVNDWESNGKVTVLRRQNAPSKNNRAVAVDNREGNGKPAVGMSQPSSGFESQSSDSNSDLGHQRIYSQSKLPHEASSLPLDAATSKQQDVISRLSVRTTEVGKSHGKRSAKKSDSIQEPVAGNYQQDNGNSKSLNMKGVKNPPSQRIMSTDSGIALDGAEPVYSLRAKDSSDCQVAPTNSIQEHIRASQLMRRNNEIAISDVYHDRNVGLGLAPSLSTILMSSDCDGIASAAGDLQQESDDVDSVVSKFSPSETGSASRIPMLPDQSKPESKPLPPPKQIELKPCPPTRSAGSCFNPKMNVHKFGKSRHNPPPIPPSLINNYAVLTNGKRDEADGRSVHDMSHSLSRMTKHHPNLNNFNDVSSSDRKPIIAENGEDVEFYSYATTNPAYDDDAKLNKRNNRNDKPHSEVAEIVDDKSNQSSSSESEDFSTLSNLTVRKVNKINRANNSDQTNNGVNNVQSSSC